MIDPLGKTPSAVRLDLFGLEKEEARVDRFVHPLGRGIQAVDAKRH